MQYLIQYFRRRQINSLLTDLCQNLLLLDI